MEELTEPQAKCLAAIVELTGLYGYPPSVRDLGVHLGKTPQTIHALLGHLKEKGYIRSTPNVARSIVVVDNA